jgi:MinD superfamily P-loop ATPase
MAIVVYRTLWVPSACEDCTGEIVLCNFEIINEARRRAGSVDGTVHGLNVVFLERPGRAVKAA